MKEIDVVGLLLARRENYDVGSVNAFYGNTYTVMMGGRSYNAVVLVASFDYYVRRYHMAKVLPTLVICFEHTTVLPIPVLSLKGGNLAQAYELPQDVSLEDLQVTRRSKLAHKVLLGMSLSGMNVAKNILRDLPETTRRRYTGEIKSFGKRGRGRPVGLPPASKKSKAS